MCWMLLLCMLINWHSIYTQAHCLLCFADFNVILATFLSYTLLRPFLRLMHCSFMLLLPRTDRTLAHNFFSITKHNFCIFKLYRPVSMLTRYAISYLSLLRTLYTWYYCRSILLFGTCWYPTQLPSTYVLANKDTNLPLAEWKYITYL